MTCAFSPTGRLVACGGLDNICSVYALPQDRKDSMTNSQNPYAALQEHDGYLSCCRFLPGSDDKIITSSGDSNCILWDVETRSALSIFTDHTGDVMSIDVDDNCFISGSCDSTAKLWDHRIGNNSYCVKTFAGHESDINSIKYFPDNNAFGTASDDSTCRLFDIRSYGQVNLYALDKILCAITSIDFSATGRFLFAGYDDYSCYVWDTLGARIWDTLVGHKDRVSCLGVGDDGKALCTGSWDHHLKIWA